jgi:hypothetical protein
MVFKSELNEWAYTGGAGVIPFLNCASVYLFPISLTPALMPLITPLPIHLAA